MSRSQQEYWKSSQAAERGNYDVEKVLEQVEKGLKKKEDFTKMFDRSYRLRQVLEENEKDYKKLIDITNQKWDAYEQSIGSVYLQAEMNDQSRLIL